MNSAIERLLGLRVENVMSGSVVELEQQAPLGQAARILRDAQVSGAPVVDSRGKCTGILTSIDFLRFEAQRFSGTVAGSGGRNGEDEATEVVAGHMTDAVQTISAQDTLMQAAREMVAQHIHHLLVLDAGGHPQGMVSSLDIVAALVNAIEE